MSFCNTVSDLELKVFSIQSWATKWHLKIGVKKCGIMVFRPLSFTTFDPAPNIRINDETIPIVETYKYLGITLDVHLAWDPFVTFKKKALQKMYFMTLPVLNNRSLSIGFRVRMFHTFIIGTLKYGIELLYGSIKIVQALQFCSY
jgi:hypothetical protein